MKLGEDFWKALGRLWQALGALGKATDRPPDRPTDYIYKLPINRSSGPILKQVLFSLEMSSLCYMNKSICLE